MTEYDGTGGARSIRLSHAYIADGDAADSLVLSAICSAADGVPCGHCRDCEKASRHIHPDITVINRLKDKNGKIRREIIVDQIRELKEDIYIVPNETARKVYVINEADTMNTNAQNAFLHMLEEPPAYVVFVLKTQNPAALLPTVRSRCINYRGGPETIKDGETKITMPEEFAEAVELADDFVSAIDDNVRLVECMFRLERLKKDAFAVFINCAREKLAPMLRSNPNPKKAVMADDMFMKAGEMLDLNVNTGHISGMLCAALLNDIMT